MHHFDFKKSPDAFFFKSISLKNSKTECCLEDLPGAMTDRDGWQESQENPCCPCFDDDDGYIKI